MKHSSLFILAPLAALVLTGCTEAPAEMADKSPRPVQVIELGANSQQGIKRFSGVLEAVDSANLAFKVPGTIEQVLVGTGDAVSKGQVIARLDPHDYQVTVMELEARLEEAKAAQALAAIELKRVKQATGDNAIAAVNLDRAQSGYKRSNAMVKVVQQNLQKARDALSYTELKAPFDGIIGKRFNEQFEQAAPGIPMFTLHQPEQLQAVIDVPESLASQVSHATTATVSWYGAEQTIPARLTETSTLPDPIKQTYTLTYVLEGDNISLLPGKAIELNITYEQTKDNYCVPYSAVISSDNGTGVFVVKNGKAVLSPVDIQSAHRDQACITGSVQPGDKLVTAGAHYLEPNQLVGSTQIVSAVQ
ncbi:efflux transporter periplasmic adaptor subunit [Photobacterium proteolyticum]|uniref:Efflux transporter periplasmic adaptor subunit n=1 Tax=Photobacterium proteolyticum TaxID=1903952 RepID=A0A1Q9GV61_9GAMM|nr:efflux RND transporter periplasmic adaptor subunit [Photobacterium proteolyticum]OLQ79044.1 efflux transporter periplasmic adaptor subunit [Photobacterium proteolyticum]